MGEGTIETNTEENADKIAIFSGAIQIIQIVKEQAPQAFGAADDQAAPTFYPGKPVSFSALAAAGQRLD